MSRALRPDPYTYIATGEGWLFLASVLDLGSRRLLGYSMGEHMPTELVFDALGMALAARGGAAAGVIAHADRGSQYTSNDYLDFCAAHQLRPSVGKTGICWDNAVAESFWSSLKRECIHGQVFATRADARRAISGGSTGTTRPAFTRVSTRSPRSSGSSSTVIVRKQLHNPLSGRRGDAQVDQAEETGGDPFDEVDGALP